jgi:Flp pilus assembly protein TadG
MFVAILLMLLASVMDLGLLLSDHLAITYASRQAALVAAQAATNPAADCDALAAVASDTANHPGLAVTRIVIYEADSNGQPIGGAGNTSYADVYLNNPGCTNPSAPPTPQPGNWLPATRNATFFGANSLGVEIDYTYTWQTSIIASGTLSVHDATVMPIVPG